MGGLNTVDIVVIVLFSLLTTSSAILMELFITTALVLVNPLIFTVAPFGFGRIYATVAMLLRKRLARNSRVRLLPPLGTRPGR